MCYILDVYIHWEVEKYNFHFCSLNWIISVKNEGKVMKVAGDIDKIYLEGAMSHFVFI